ncbi:unnamed protein product [Ectocarpus sp. 12 AP-2014]
MDGGVGGEAGGEGAGLKPPVLEQEFHDGVSDVQASAGGGASEIGGLSEAVSRTTL